MLLIKYIAHQVKETQDKLEKEIQQRADMKLHEDKLQDSIKERDATIEGGKKAVAFWTAKFNDLDKRFNEHKEASQKEREHLESRLQQTAQTEKEKLLKLIANAS